MIQSLNLFHNPFFKFLSALKMSCKFSFVWEEAQMSYSIDEYMGIECCDAKLVTCYDSKSRENEMLICFDHETAGEAKD